MRAYREARGELFGLRYYDIGGFDWAGEESEFAKDRASPFNLEADFPVISRSTVLRPVSRVLLVDSDDRLLLFDTALAYTRAWLAPGGALEKGETHEEAAVRELEEETGLRGVSLGPWVWTVEFRFVYRGLTYDQRERYFVARTPSHEVSRSLWSATEATEILEPRWWTLDEIRRSQGDFRPANAADLLPDVIAGRYPREPLRAIVERSARTV